MTDDRANPMAGEGSARALNPLAGGGLRRVGVVCKHTLKTAGSEPFGEFSRPPLRLEKGEKEAEKRRKKSALAARILSVRLARLKSA
jgi:hypothetical protein